MILRTTLSIEAERYRQEMDNLIDDCYRSLSDDPVYPKAMPEEAVIFKPCREGKSLHSIVTRRSIRKRSYCQRWADK